MPSQPPVRRISISPVTAIAIVALAAMFFLSRSSFHLSKEKGVEVTPPTNASSSR